MLCKHYAFGALRQASLTRARIAPTASFFHSTPVSTFAPRTFLAQRSHSFSPIAFNPSSCRYLSLLSRFRAQPSPSPTAVANISRLEGEANAHPHDVTKQVELFQGLVDMRMKAGYNVVISRWERTCEFEPESPLIASDVAFKLYLESLKRSGLESSVNSAVRRRESAIASHHAASAGVTVEGATSNSQAIAQDVLSSDSGSSEAPTDQPPPPAANTSTATSFAAALASGAGVSGNPIHVTISEPKGHMLFKALRFVVMTAAGLFICLIVLSVILENSGLMKGGPKQSQYEVQNGKPAKFSDVQGVDEAKEELAEVVAFLKDPSTFTTLGGQLPKGILLTGPPGTGKTLLARAVAGEAGVPFLFASGSDFDEMFVGVGAKRVRELFEAARKKQPAIIFIDELDAVGGKRSSRDSNYMKQTLNQLLVEMDGFLQSEGVIVIAATNFPESLDQALVRPGRFDRHIAVPLPDVRGRVQILKHHMRNVTTAPEVDSAIIARGTPGFSGADLQNLVNQAAIQASRQGLKEVNLTHFEWAKDRILMGAERKSSYVSEKEKKLTAYHEAGHTLAALYTDGAMPLHKVTCVPRGHALGITFQLPENDRLSVTYKEFKAELDVCMGGRVAEQLIYGDENVTSGASSDLQHATRTASRMVKSFGYSNKVGPVVYSDQDDVSPQKREQIEAEVTDLLQKAHERVSVLLKEREAELHLLANALVRYETLDSDEVKKVLKGEKIRDKEPDISAGPSI